MSRAGGQKEIFATQDVRKFKGNKLEDHVLIRPDTYVGNHDFEPKEQIVWKVNEGKLKFEVGVITPPLEQIFMEVLSNAADAAEETNLAGMDPIQIEVDITPNTVHIKNYGIGVPVDYNEEGEFIPSSIFGTFLFSSNLDDTGDRFKIGRNGYGAKLTNAFSKRFEVYCADASRGLLYHQVWENNMKIVGEVEVTEYPKGDRRYPSFVSVTFTPDMEWFKVEGGVFSPFVMEVFMAHCWIVALETKVPVVVNGNSFSFKGSQFFEYVQLFYPGITKKECIYSSSQVVEEKKKEEGNWEFYCLDTPNQGHMISFANATLLRAGGKAVDDVFRTCLKEIVSMAKNISSEVRLTKNHVSPHITIFFRCRANKPNFTGQNKSFMLAPRFSISIPEKEMEKIKKWDCTRILFSSIMDRRLQKAIKEDGKNKIELDKHNKANNWKHPRKDLRNSTILAICEGDSAVVIPRLFQEQDPDNWGTFSLHGKIPNVFDVKDVMDEISNKDLGGLRKILNIPLVETDRKRIDLWYGNVMIMADADPDGEHISSELLSFFALRVPFMFEEGRVFIYMSPVIKATKGREKLTFHSEASFNQWCKEKNIQEDGNHGWNFEYNKGLASNSKEDIKEEVKSFKFLTVNSDNETEDIVALAFSKTKADERKKWVKTWMENEKLDISFLQKVSISHYFNAVVPHYIEETILRAIPYFTDGLKEVQRKMLYTAFLMIKGKKKIVKTMELSCRAAGDVCYAHGEKSIADAISRANLTWPGTNNLPLFQAEAAFAVRFEGAKKLAAARYTKTTLPSYINLIFRKEDKVLYSHRIDSGKKAEYETFFPIVPLHLINGVKGVGMAYSTSIPSFHPLHIISWIRNWLNGTSVPFLRPWFNGFKGNVRVEGITYFTEGAYTFDGKDLVITELPIGVIPKKYQDTFLIPLVEEKTASDVKGYSSDESIKFILKDFKGELSPNYQDNLAPLKLINQGRMSNMTVVLPPVATGTANLSVRTYNNTANLMQDYCEWRLSMYQVRNEKEMERLKNEIKILKEKIDLIVALRANEKVVYMNKQKRDKIITDWGFSASLVHEASIALLSIDEDTIVQQINRLQEALNALINTSPIDVWMKELEELEEKLCSIYKWQKDPYISPPTEVELHGIKKKEKATRGEEEEIPENEDAEE